MAQAAAKKKIFDGRYEILSIVGRGARSVVYHARHIDGDKGEVALKVLLTKKGDLSASERLRHEALAMVSARHKYVIRLDDYHSIGPLSYLSMEYAPHSDLRRYLQQREENLSPTHGELYFLQIAEALHFMHQAGMIHRDIKPDNLLVIREQEIRLADFGVAVLPGEESSLEELQKGIGTMNYLAPEVLAGKQYDPQADIYALGVTFYELLSGAHPFEQAPLAKQLEARADGAFPALQEVAPDVPAYLAKAIMSCLRYESEKRVPSLRDCVGKMLEEKGRLKKKDSPEAKTLQKTIPPKVTPLAKPPIKEPVSEEPSAPQAEQASKVSEVSRSAQKEATEEKVTPVKPAKSPGPKRFDEPAPKKELGAQKSRFAAVDNERSNTQQSRFAEPERHSTPQPAQKPKASLAQKAIEPKHGKESSARKRRRVASSLRLKKVKERIEKKRKKASPPSPAPNSERPPAQEAPEKPIEKPLSKTWQKDTTKQTRPKTAQDPELKKRFQRTAAIAAVVILLLYSGKLFIEETQVGQQIRQVFISDSDAGSNTAATATIEFPYLPEGIYPGHITGMATGKRHALSLVSFHNGEKLAVIVGISGWKVPVIDLRQYREEAAALTSPEEILPLRVAANGMVLDLSAENLEGRLIGYVYNVVTGQEGQWVAELNL